MTSSTAVRRIRSDEWDAVRELRVESVNDPDAGIAFLETPETVAARDMDFWRRRTIRAAEAGDAAQFVADDGGDLVGSVTVLVRAPGSADHLGRTVSAQRADVVGVYVRPTHRGDGTIDRLLAAAVEWAAEAGVTTLSLDVHTDNVRAQGAYRRAGFVATGEVFTGPVGSEITMARSVGPRAASR